MRTPIRIAALVTCLASAAALAAGARADDITTTTGKKLTGKIVAVEADTVTLVVGENKAQIPARDIVVVDLGNKSLPLAKDVTTFSEIELTDGSTFRVAKFALKDKAFEVEQLPAPDGVAPKLEIPMSAVFSAMKKADDPKVRDNWKRMLGAKGKRDMYVIAQENGFTFVQGTVLGGGADEKKRPFINFEKDSGGKEDLLLSRAAGLVFHQPQPASIPATLCKVTDVFGNTLTAAAITLTPEGVSVTTVAGVKVTYPSTTGLVRFDYALGNVAYLSDLDPQLEVPELAPEEKGKRINQPAAYIKDRSFSNNAIKLDNQTFPKGVVLAPDTIAAFNLNGDYSQFKATVGIDENGLDTAAAARVTIEADGQVLFSEQLKRKDKPKGLVLAVKGVKQLRIIIETDTPLNGNYVTLADARVQK